MGREFDSVGDSFEDFLIEAGIRGEVHAAAQKRVIAWQLEEARKAADLSKTAMAEAMRTSRTQLDRVLDPENVAVSLDTLERAARSVGKRIRLILEDVP